VFGFVPNTEVTLVTLVTLLSPPFLVRYPAALAHHQALRLQREESLVERHERHRIRGRASVPVGKELVHEGLTGYPWSAPR